MTRVYVVVLKLKLYIRNTTSQLCLRHNCVCVTTGMVLHLQHPIRNLNLSLDQTGHELQNELIEGVEIT